MLISASSHPAVAGTRIVARTTAAPTAIRIVFSSRRPHTIYWRDWSSDVCSSDLGDLLVVFSDGLSEARNHAGEEYGEERLVQFAARRRDATAEELRRAVFDELDKWTGGAERDEIGRASCRERV